jgi:PAS domain S-box-containing protein
MSDIDNLFLASLIKSSDDAIIGKTLEGIITTWNEGAERMYQYNESEIVGKHITTIFPTDKLNEYDFIMNKVKNGEALDHHETIRKRKDGSLVTVSVTISPIKTPQGKIIGVSTIARDITEQKRLQHEVERKKDEFLGIASHELKTPLTSIKGYTQILERIIQESNDKKALKYIEKQKLYIDKLHGLIGDLLDISKIEAGKMLFNFTQFDFDELVKETVDAIQPITDSHRLIVSGKSNKTIVGDCHRIEQVITNLLTNAIKYSPHADRVEIEVSSTEDSVKVAVKDYGIGIPTEDNDKIFDRFFRVESSATKFSGLGIGLYISSQIVHRHHGKISVASKLGEGSTFTFELPLQPSSQNT